MARAKVCSLPKWKVTTVQHASPDEEYLYARELGARLPAPIADAYVTADDVCRILRISLPTLRRWIKDQKFPAAEPRGSDHDHRRWRVSVLNGFITKTPGG